MKKYFLIVMLIIPALIWAEDMSFEATVHMHIPNTENFIQDIGFTSEPEKVGANGTAPTKVDSLSITVGDSEYDDIYVYWILKGGAPLTISLYMEDVLSMGNNTIDWSASWDKFRSDISGAEETVSIGYLTGEYGKNNSGIVLDRSKVISVTDTGSTPIAISVNAHNDLVAGEYSGTLVLLIDSVN